jgi:UDP-N-acetyl-D-glucosamine dehydrogenase
MPRYVVQRVGEALNTQGKPFRGSRVLVLGLAYKKDIDDTRESPSFEIMEQLVHVGAQVSFHDPFFKTLPHKRDYQLKLRRAEWSAEEVASHDCVVIVTDHSSYDYAWIVEHAKLVVDTRGATRHLGSFEHVFRA